MTQNKLLLAAGIVGVGILIWNFMEKEEKKTATPKAKTQEVLLNEEALAKVPEPSNAPESAPPSVNPRVNPPQPPTIPVPKSAPITSQPTIMDAGEL